ncbi:hypothetical protein C7T94_12080 [Pedobacter yulinensis]|uniref:Helix-hairpin-helix domain-containing protein n=1 Tax=Pedobacter yulinensis TaxID=2126353 RepID=A0A2T3HLN1_9SPHI|nr:helix-hairpin-helix domain-containing protein [Pedobacter yulinensis]PST83313.1 hypothetical protein C7T94_12080 [Pedobacter yulinensis]
MLFRWLLLLAICLVRPAFARQAGEKEITDVIESMAEAIPEHYDMSELTGTLEYLQKHPLNLNQATATELKQLFFLSPIQITNLLAHIKESGALLDLLELQALPGFSEKVIQALKPFVTCAPSPTQRRALFSAGHDLLLRYGLGLKDSAENKGTGSPDRMLLRYRLSGTGAVNAGLTLEKDPGEPLVAGGAHLPDFVSANLSFKGNGPLRQIVLGDYGLQFGQGLTMWTGFSFGKSPDITSTARKETGLRPYYSVNEYAFLRGLAITLKTGLTHELTLFGSKRMLDASVSEDGTVTALQQSGLHRTPSELRNRQRLGQLVYGGAMQFTRGRLEATLTSFVTMFNRTFAPGKQVYELLDFRGDKLFNCGLAYGYTLRNVSFSGEVAADGSGRVALIQGMLLSLSRAISLGLSYRNYAASFQNFFAQGVAEGSETSNERGLYTGIQLHLGKWNFSAYTDWFSFPWLRYRVDAPSSGREHFAELSWTPDKVSRFTLRMKTETKAQNGSVLYSAFPEDTGRSNYRLEGQWMPGRQVTLQTRVELSNYRKLALPEYGLLIYQDVQWAKPFARLSANLRLGWFRTASYNSRIYAYENDVLYGAAFGVFSGRGLKAYLNARYKLFKGADCYFRWGTLWRMQAAGIDETRPYVDFRIQLRYLFE